MKIKLGAILALAFISLGSTTLTAQEVTLGSANFAESSDQIPADWYYPMAVGETTYEGYGENAGGTLTEAFSRGETVVGVKCLKRHVVISVPGSTDVIEDWWMAVDTSGDVRVLKRTGTKLVPFVASAVEDAPMFLPGDPVADQTWQLFGRTVTVISAGESLHGGVLSIKTEAEGTQSQKILHEAGKGMISSETVGATSTETSGWRPSAPPVAAD